MYIYIGYWSSSMHARLIGVNENGVKDCCY
jgi:hypothetical protein